MTGPSRPEPGPLGEEAAKLAEAVLDRARQVLGELRGAQPPVAEDSWAAATAQPSSDAAERGDIWAEVADAASPSGSSAHRHDRPTAGPGDAPECRYCPICRIIALLRNDRPDVAANVAGALSTVADAILGVADSISRRPPPGSASSAGARPGVGSQPPSASSRSRVEPIDLDE
jgi:hypothetical protein